MDFKLVSSVCPKCAALATTGLVVLHCFHAEGLPTLSGPQAGAVVFYFEHDLPEAKRRGAITEPQVRAITNDVTVALTGLGITASAGTLTPSIT